MGFSPWRTFTYFWRWVSRWTEEGKGGLRRRFAGGGFGRMFRMWAGFLVWFADYCYCYCWLQIQLRRPSYMLLQVTLVPPHEWSVDMQTCHSIITLRRFPFPTRPSLFPCLSARLRISWSPFATSYQSLPHVFAHLRLNLEKKKLTSQLNNCWVRSHSLWQCAWLS